MTKERSVRSTVVFQLICVETIGSFVRGVDDKAMSIIVVSKGRHAQKQRIGTIVSSPPKRLVESHVWSEILSILQAMV